jgi:hypothetical protein
MISRHLKSWRVLAVVAGLGVGLVAAQAVLGQTTSASTTTTLDPFNPTVTTSTTTTATLGPISAAATRPPVRTPVRPPVRSPFRP